MDLQQAWDDAAATSTRSLTETEVHMALLSQSTDQLRIARRFLRNSLWTNDVVLAFAILAALGFAQYPPSAVGATGIAIVLALGAAGFVFTARLRRKMDAHGSADPSSASYLTSMVREFRAVNGAINGLRGWLVGVPAFCLYVLASDMAGAPSDATFGSWWASLDRTDYLSEVGLSILVIVFLAVAAFGLLTYVMFYRPMARAEATLRELRELQAGA